MPLVNSTISYTGLVEKYVGTAYDKMAAIHAELDELLRVAGTIEDGSFQEVVDVVDDIEELSDKIDGFNSTYYGARDSAPVVDPLGNPITEGDLYYDTYKGLLMVFVGEFWIPMGTVEHTVEKITYANNHINNGNIVAITKPYLPGTNNLTVHRNGQLLVNNITSPAEDTYGYIEIDEYTVQMTDATQHSDILVFQIGTEAATVTHVGEVGRYWQQTQIEGETIIRLPEGVTYIKGSNNLTVHIKRQDAFQTMELQVLHEYNQEGDVEIFHDYNEDTPSQISFKSPLEQWTEIQLTIGHVVASRDAHFEVEVSPGEPNVNDYEEGKFWFKSDTGRLYMLYFDELAQSRQWIAISNEDYIIPQEGYMVPAPSPTPIIHGTIFQDRAPVASNFAEGTLWFNVNTGNMHINYFDDDTHQWVKVST